MYITPIERSQQLMSYHLKSISKTGASMIVKLQKLYHIIDVPTKTDKLTWKKKVNMSMCLLYYFVVTSPRGHRSIKYRSKNTNTKQLYLNYLTT
jgi:hypothetical protein